MTVRFLAALCAICDRPLTVHQQAVGPTCDDARCKHQQLKKRLRVDAESAARVRAKLVVLRDRALRTLALNGVPLPMAALPSNDRVMTQLSEERRAKFREYLTGSIAEAVRRAAAAEPPAEEDDRQLGSSPSNAEKRVMGQGCATCRGSCCEAGAHHAFLNPEQIQKQMRRHPELSPDDMLEHYVLRLPSRSYVDSCVYHAERGCVLRREERSEICNRYYCAGLSELWHGMTCAGSLRGFVGAVSNERILRSAVVEENAG